MRIITSTDLSEEQEDILLDAPLDGVVLILGPPGSGKTVMAFLRAEALVKRFNAVTLIMYNKVLQTFSKNGTSKRAVDVRTMHSWMWQWWRGIMNGRQAPEVSRFVYDWDEMFNLLAQRQQDKKLKLKKVDWEHLIIDEGQDFTNKMYRFLDLVRNVFFSGKDIPSLTILADENQRINEDNSTIDDIKKLLHVEERNVFHLTKNYRNTDEINEFIQRFYVGGETGRTKPSGKHGERPKLVNTHSFNETIKYIKRYIKAHDNEEIAIIVENNKVRKRYHEELEERLEEHGLYVQTYASNDYRWKDTSLLRFDEGGTVTILNKQSCKGLEFDAVFIPELQRIDVADDNTLAFKMEMYVMCSRARKTLVLMTQNSSGQELPIMRHFPRKEENIVEYIDA
jgi:DNA helicase IV